VYVESHVRNRIVENRRFDVVRTKRRKQEEGCCHTFRDNSTNIFKVEIGEK